MPETLDYAPPSPRQSIRLPLVAFLSSLLGIPIVWTCAGFSVSARPLPFTLVIYLAPPVASGILGFVALSRHRSAKARIFGVWAVVMALLWPVFLYACAVLSC